MNRSLLAMNLGEMRNQAAYKLAERGKLFVKVKAAYSSQECSECHHIAKENRKTQAAFQCAACGYAENADYNASNQCVACGYTENADYNASNVMKHRGIDLVLSGTLAKVRTEKQIAVKRTKARETASISSGGAVSRALPATADDATQIPTPEAVT